ncbi:MAG: metallophosphoesterase [Bacteroidales bacterium]|jgi:predicted MPP superfamily phosphohydrolase|nr:metallophosphoesterase [Bacteroidales bacterium]
MTFLIIAVLIILLDVIAVWGLKRTFPSFGNLHQKGIRKAFIIQAAVSLVIVLGGYFLQRQVHDYRLFACYYYLFGLMAALYIPKSVYALFLLVDRILSSMSRRRRQRLDIFPRESRRMVAKCGFWAGAVFVFLILWGILFGRFGFDVDRVEITVDDLPPAFNGYKIVQISDIHAGSFAGFTNRFRKAVDLVNRQEPDLIVFTGDMVNNFAGEAAPLIPIFSQLEARDGKYAVLGNHDYGGYSNWDSPADSAMNHADLECAIERMGFVLLNNRSVVISRYNHDRMALIGIENWGMAERHPRRGDLGKAMKSVQDVPFKALLSHDPSFWPEYVKGKTDIVLTLSGHTHGMQMGVKWGKKRYSPASWMHHRYWAGLYRAGKQYLYVNRGLGVIGYPGRIGMSPEITVITLWKEKSLEQP